MIRSAACLCLLLVAGAAVAQEPPFPRTGERYRLLGELPAEFEVRTAHSEFGLISLGIPDTDKLVLSDRNGQPLVRAGFRHIFPLSEDLVSAQSWTSGKWALIDVPGRKVLGEWDAVRSFGLLKSGEVIHYRKKGETVLCALEGSTLRPVSEVYELIAPHHSEGMFWASRNGAWGIVGVDGKIKIPFRYESIRTVGDWVRVRLAVREGLTEKHPDARSNRTGLLTRDGWQVLPCRYNSVDVPVGGVATWTLWGENSKSGQAECGAVDLATGEELLRLVSTDSLEYGIENVDGSHFIVKHRLAVNGGAGLPMGGDDWNRRVYRAGEGYLSKDSFHSIKPIRTASGLLFLTQKRKSVAGPGPRELRNSDFGVVDSQVLKILQPCEQVLVVSRTEPRGERCVLSLEGKTVIPGDRFIPVIPPRDEEGIATFRGRIPVRGTGASADRFGFADETGKMVIPARFRDGNLFNRHGITRVLTDTGWGVIDREGKPVAEPRFGGAACFPDEPYFLLGQDGEVSLHDLSGTELFRAPIDCRIELVRLGEDLRVFVSQIQDEKVIHKFLVELK